MNTRERGVTLIDTMIATAIVIVILGVAYPGFMIANDTIVESGRRDRLERAGDQLLKVLVEELRAGLVSGVTAPPAAPSVTITRPDRSVTLDQINNNGDVPWLPATRTIRFRQTGTLKEADEGEDLNRDGDQADTFALGVLEIDDGSEVRPLMTRAEVMLGLPGFSGDLDGDGIGDPLFTQVNRSVRIQLFLTDKNETGHRMKSDVTTTLHLRNVQE